MALSRGEQPWVLALLFGILVFLLFLIYRERRNRRRNNAILMVGTPQSGKTLLTHGIMTYLQATETKQYTDNIDSQNRVLRQEVSDQILADEWPTRTNAVTANRISFTMGKKSFDIYDFSGESIESQNEISRENTEDVTAINSFRQINISTGVGSGSIEIKMDRRKLKHIIYIIPAIGGSYQAKSFVSAERMLKWVRELTIRQGGVLEDYYSDTVLSQKKAAHKIKIHAIFTKFSDVEESVNSNEQLKESLLSLCPELYSLVEDTNGSVIAVNVFSKDGTEIKQDWVGLEELTQALNMN